METNRDKAIRYLQDTHAAEKAAESMLAGLADGTDCPVDVRVSAATGLQQCRNRITLISQRLTEIGGDNSTLKDWLDNAMAKVSDLMNRGHDDIDKTTMDLVKAHAGGHALHGIYCALASYSKATGDTATQELADRAQKECHDFAHDLIPLIEACARQADKTAVGTR